MINREGKILINELEDKGWAIVNGSKQEEGEYTYVGKRGATVIDYIIVNQEALDEVRRLKIGQRTESDHLPLELEMYAEINRDNEKVLGKEDEFIERREWSVENIERYHENCNG